jgi:YHS domain-containing protein
MLLALAARAEQSGLVKPALRGLDPVELTSGKETVGSADISITRDGFEYRFANAENRRRFEQTPRLYAIQYGGACMKMGPLSGKGSTDRFAVHEGRIYLFASEQCLAAFKAAPDRFIDRPDDVPRGTAAQRQLGAELLDKAIEAIGGAERLRALDHVVVRHAITQTAGGRSRKYWQQNTLRFPGTIRVDYDHGEYKYAWLLNDNGGYFLPDGEVVEQSIREFMTRELYRQPLALLKAHQRGEALAVAMGPIKVDQTEIEQVAVAVKGATTTLGIDPASGRILQVAYRGRAGVGIGQITKTYSDFRTINGLTVPFALQGAVDGKPVSGATVTIESVQVDEPLDAGLLNGTGAVGG